MSESRDRRGSRGGAANEAGGAYRAGVAAVIGAHLLYGWDLKALALPSGAAVPMAMRLEVDQAVDDIVIELAGGGRAFIQAKRTLRLETSAGSQLAKAGSQFRRAAIESDLDPRTDRLVLAGGSVSGPIRHLGMALRRRRDPFSSAPSEAEATALERFEPLLEGLDETQRGLLLDCLTIWHCDAEEQDGEATLRAAAMLDGAIVAHGAGHRAVAALASKAREAARLRSGFDAEGLIASLREAEIELTEDASGAHGARIVSRQQASARYRQRLQASGESIQLLGVGAGLPELPLADIDAKVRAIEPWLKEERPSERPLDLLVRRRGRVLLTGLPGSGKSTALRRAAAIQAGETHSPEPIVIRLDVLARRLEKSGFEDAVVELATEDAPPADRDLLREHIRGAISSGRATLFLDALDEAHRKSRAVVGAILSFLEGADPSLEVLLATRDTKITDAAALDFREARLIPPEQLDQMIEGILRAFALHREIENPKAWVKPREKWVSQVLSRDPDLRATPLMPILLAVSAAQADHSKLPEVRAEILRQIVRDVVSEWEAGRTRDGELALGEIQGHQATDALLECFIAEGVVLAGEVRPSEERVGSIVAVTMEERWGLAPGKAQATAREAISFWDEAGVFLKSPQGGVEPRVKLFSELADAWHHSKVGDERKTRAWVRSALANGERDEALKLSASLSDTAAAELVKAAVSGTSASDMFLALEAVRQGAKLEDAGVDELVEGLIRVVRGGGQLGIKAAAELVAMDVSERLQERVLLCIRKNLPRDHALVAEVRAIVNWNLEQDEGAIKRFEVVLASDPPMPLSGNRDVRARLQLAGVDGSWSAAVAAVAEILVPLSVHNAQLAARQVERVGGRSAQRIIRVIKAAGHGYLVAERENDLRRAIKSDWWLENFGRADKADNLFLGMISELDRESEISIRDERGLDELADLFFTLGIPESESFSFANMALDHPDRVRELLRAGVLLGGFDVGKLASEARLFRRQKEESQEGDSLSQIIYMPGVDRGLTRWNRINECDRDQTVVELIRHLGGARFSAGSAAEALSAAPKDLGVHHKVLTVLDQLKGWQLQLAGQVALQTAGGDRIALRLSTVWMKSGRAPLRRMAGRFAGLAILTNPDASDLLLSALTDRDAGVREETLEHLNTENLVDQELLTAVAGARSGSTEWECRWCTHLNKQPLDDCEECHSTGPELSRELDAMPSIPF